MFKIPDFVGSFYYDHDTESYSWDGMFAMFIDIRRTIKDGVISIKGTIGDKLGDSTFEGVITDSYIEFTKKYDIASIAQGASETPIYYKGIKISKTEYSGYWTQNLEQPFDEVLPCDKVGFFLKQMAEIQKVTMIDSRRTIDISRYVHN